MAGLYTVGLTPDGNRLRMITAGQATSLTLTVSYDDGATWQPVAVRKTGAGTFESEPKPPAGATFASVRVTARGGGSAVTQTIIRAYAPTP